MSSVIAFLFILFIRFVCFISILWRQMIKVYFCLHAQQKGVVTVAKMVTVVKSTKKGINTHKKKGELMENDQDAMEVIALHSYQHGDSVIGPLE